MDYRKIWIKEYGEIPFDENGIKYEIHHIDGNRSNNVIQNLKCLSIKDHYDIHYKQEDWFACQIISSRMNINHKEKDDLIKKSSELKTNLKWITNDIQDKRIHLEEELPEGYKYGRCKGGWKGPRPQSFKDTMSKAKKGVPLSEKHKKALMGLKRGMFGKKHTEKSKRKMSEASLGVKKTVEHCENISKSHVGWSNFKDKKHTEETKRKMSKSKLKKIKI